MTQNLTFGFKSGEFLNWIFFWGGGGGGQGGGEVMVGEHTSKSEIFPQNMKAKSMLNEINLCTCKGCLSRMQKTLYSSLRGRSF